MFHIFPRAFTFKGQLEWKNILHLLSWGSSRCYSFTYCFEHLMRNSMSTYFLSFMNDFVFFFAVSEIIIMGPFLQIQMALVICRFRSSFISVHFLEYDFKHSFFPTFVFLLQGHQVCVLCILNIDPTPLNSLVKCHEKWEPPLWIKHL